MYVFFDSKLSNSGAQPLTKYFHNTPMEPIFLGKGSLRKRVKALGNSAERACAANALEWEKSENWEKIQTRVTPIFCCHTYSNFGQHFQKK